MDTSRADEWIETYKKAWASDDPADIGALFAEDAEYHTGPFDEPWRGRDAIVEKWIAQGDSKLEWSFRYDVLGVAGELAIVQGWTDYTSPDFKHSYSNVWLIQLDDSGKARVFREWWIEDPKTVDN